jgi:HlyD family secretion protein
VITDVNVDFNSRVKEGEVVAQIDPATYERALGQAEAELANAEAALELAQLNYDRAQELITSSLISKSEYDQARVSLSQANAQVKTRQANVDRAKVDLSRTTIYAPMDGLVITRRVEAGQTVAASMNTPTLFTIANDLAKMRIEAAVSEADVGGLEEGQAVEFLVDAFPGRRFDGKVQQVRYAPTTNQNVVTYTTVVDVENKDLKLRPGMTATAKFITAERKNVLTIPYAAVRFRPPAGALAEGETNATGVATAPVRAQAAAGGTPGGGRPAGGEPGGAGARKREEPDGPKPGTVYVLERAPTSMGGERTTLRAVTVKLGIGDGTNVEVLEGLREGDLVVSGLAPAESATAMARNPFGGPFGGPGRPR